MNTSATPPRRGSKRFGEEKYPRIPFVTAGPVRLGTRLVTGAGQSHPPGGVPQRCGVGRERLGGGSEQVADRTERGVEQVREVRHLDGAAAFGLSRPAAQSSGAQARPLPG